LQQFKNVALHPVDVGGRILASGEIAELSPHAHAVHDAVRAGDLLALATFREAPTADPAPEEQPGAAGEAPAEAAEKPVKTSTPRQRANRES
jgi:hypothetical protein